MKTIAITLAATLALAGCASQPDSIAAAYVSPTPYAGLSCSQLSAEGQRVQTRLTQATAAQQQSASSDGAKMAVALVLFAPAALFIGGDKAPAAELASLKGQAQAVQASSAAKGC